MTVSAQYDLKLSVSDTPVLNIDGVTDPTITRSTTTNGTLDANSTVPATKSWNDTGSLSTGAATIDLTALSDGNLPTQDWTGLKVQLLKFSCAASNSAGITIKDGATNGYNIFGDASGQVTVPAGATILCYWADTLDDIAAADATIDLSSSDLDATYTIEMVAG